MVSENSYLAYKRDTSCLVCWMVNTANSIIETLNLDLPLNNSGQVTVASLVDTAELIGKHMKRTPTAIFHLMDSIISARSKYHAEFLEMAEDQSDNELDRSNASHGYFIDALSKAFKLLGGDAWASEKENTQAEDDSGVEDAEKFLSANKFSVLDLEPIAGSDSSDEESNEESRPAKQLSRRAQRRPGKGRQSKRKKNKNKNKAKAHVKQTRDDKASLSNVPLENCQIVLDEEGSKWELNMAFDSIMDEWISMRKFLQGIWHDVAYKGLNVAVAGSLTNIAVGILKETELKIMQEFPGNGSMMQIATTRAEADTCQAVIKYHLRLRGGRPQGEGVDVDVKELLLVHAFTDLVDFVLDYQKNRTGKPTKRMMASINDWDPDLNLQQATQEQRLKWRRSYTINWLYDLVNVYSSVIRIEMHELGNQHVLENVCWSPPGFCVDFHFGAWGSMKNFAAFVTALAMQRPGTTSTDVLKRIPAGFVFQLQCIVDAFTISRGWAFDRFGGHVVRSPPIAFNPRRDLDTFKGPSDDPDSRGCLWPVTDFEAAILDDCLGEKRPDKLKETACWSLAGFSWGFAQKLGHDRGVLGQYGTPPSRFSGSNPNGLWEFSPFMCASGLLTCLDQGFRAAVIALEALAEPTLVVYIHNMLVHKGYIAKRIELYQYLSTFFFDGLFTGDRIPASEFHCALVESLAQRGTVQPQPTLMGYMYQTFMQKREMDPSEFPSEHRKRLFVRRPLLSLLNEAEWHLGHIPDHWLFPPSALLWIRISQTEGIVDLVTGKLADTPLVRRVKQAWPDAKDGEIIEQINFITKRKKLTEFRDAVARHHQRPDPNTEPGVAAKRTEERGGARRGPRLAGDDLLALMEPDAFGDVCGTGEMMSGVNFIKAVAKCFQHMIRIEKRLKHLRNPLYIRAFEADDDDDGRRSNGEKRTELVLLAMREENEECLRAMAETFEDCAEFKDCVYWGEVCSWSKFKGHM